VPLSGYDPLAAIDHVGSGAGNMIKFVVKPTDRGWAIYQEGTFAGDTRRGEPP